MSHESWSVNFFLTICFCFRFPQVELVGTLVSIVVLLLQIIHDLHQIISMAREGWESISTSLPITHYWRSVNFTVILTIPFCFRFQQVVPVLELIGNVVGSLVSLVVLLQRLIRICRRIWSILTARPPVVVANDHQNEVPLAVINFGQNDVPPTDAGADATNGQNDVIVNKELNIWTHQKKRNVFSHFNLLVKTNW